MDGSAITSIVGAGVTLIGLIITAWRYKHAGAIESQTVTDARAAMIAKETADELARLYSRLEKLEKIVEELQRRDREKQTTINEQAGKISAQATELERTNVILTATRTLFVSYAARVELAWRDGHVMPTLTAQERAVLEDSISREQLAQLIKEQKK